MKTFKECLDEISQKNNWDNWSHVLYMAENRRTIGSILEDAYELFVFQISNIISYDDKDEDEKLQEIKSLIKL